MHDFSFFLLKSLLPVGGVAILFFGIGLLLAKFIWGRFQQRLTNAIEENMNLASQWSALGASQQDLFKKLRVRWQSDRDAFETVIGEKDLVIARLGEQLKAGGATLPDIPMVSAEDIAARAKVRELEAALAAERAEVARLREQSEQGEMPVLPFAVLDPKVAKAPAEEDLAGRIRDLEQDLIDTHDELHRVRADYEKQVALVESLEAKLIAVPAPVEPPVSAEIAQMAALLAQRGREAKARFQRPHLLQSEAQASTEASLAGMASLHAAALVASEEEKKSLEVRLAETTAGLETRLAETAAALEARLADAGTALDDHRAEIARLEEIAALREAELAGAREQLAELEALRRRRGSLQGELNDAHHELYDVRRALNLRIESIGRLESRLAELAEVETLLATERTEAAAVSAQLNEARRELSEVRIALSARTGDYQKARAQMEELEAIIGDRSAEVNDLSTDLRQQRDLVRQLKNTLAETQGELEALTEESRTLNAGVKARAAFADEQQSRIAALEVALAERYRELNLIRVEAEEHSRTARYHESRATHLESELARRGAEFDASDRRIANVEEELEAANTRIAELSGKLEKTEASLGELSQELQGVSREKDETLRDLERASRRVAELEEAARKREVQLVEIERELVDARTMGGSLGQKIERLQVELESALEERRLSAVSVGEMEEALRASDERTLQLSTRLDEKEVEVASLATELEKLRHLVDERSAGESEARARVAALEEEIEVRVDELRRELASAEKARSQEIDAQADEIARLREETEALSARHAEELTMLGEQSGGETAKRREELEVLTARHAEELATLREQALAESARLREEGAAEIAGLREQLAAEAARLEEETALRRASLSEIETLREKLAARSESIRDLQNQISSVMMQRDSRDSELSLLKEKLRAMEDTSREALSGLGVASLAKRPAPTLDPAALEAVSQNLVAAATGEEGISLDALPAVQAHHPPKPVAETAEAPVAWAGNDDDLTVFFNDAASVPSQAEIEKIDRCARSIRRLGRRVEVTVIGYAGSEGSPDFNESVSARRADAVRERLVERGVSQSVVKVKAAGQDRRFSDWKARRVEMIVAPIAVAETVN